MKILSLTTAISLAALAVAPLQTEAVSLAGAGIYFDELSVSSQAGTINWGEHWTLSVQSSIVHAFGTESQSFSGTDIFYEAYVAGPNGDAFADAGFAADFFGAGTDTFVGTSGFPLVASGSAKSTLSRTFSVTAPEQFIPTTTEVSIAADIFSDLLTETFWAGISSSSSTYFKLWVNNDLVFDFADDIEVGFDDYDESWFEGTALGARELNFGETYTLSIELGADVIVSSGIDQPVPEASTVLATGLGLGLVAFARLRRRVAR